MDDTTKFCEGGAATLEANVQGTYAWSNASTSSTIQVSSPGTFSVTVTDLNNCVSSATTEVVEIMNVVAGYTVTPWYLTQVFTSTSQNADSYFWDFNDGTGATSTAQSPTHIFPWPGGTYNVIHVAINECGTDTFKMEIRADEKTGINTLDENTSVNVFPNPNNGSFNVQINSTSSDAIQIQLIDLQGRVILDRNIGSVNGVHTENIEVENLSKGIYILKTGNDMQSETTRVVIR
jgi:PKD repeat protein